MSQIKLKKGQLNENVTLTLTEKVTISNPIFLFEFISDTTKQSNTCICTDLSIEGAQRQRANIFNITEGTDDRLNSSLVLFNSGRYHYIIREQISSSNLDTELSGAIIERGIMLLADFETSQYIQHEINVTYTVHEPF